MVMSGSSTTLKAFKETDMMATARSVNSPIEVHPVPNMNKALGGRLI
jgi:hypothetical protein